ncbi:Outer membrane protein beta-barrel domain-containing protein [Pedobacter sp. ok626]|uniref:porin family protein n=1 Tax=Pedobacter sp. ok626 TaxID=1761882 RepID=UPI00088A3DFD|nr:porin family protein [Pedobacter sp. ok626]SDL32929.1 Outer membrane protein beta-barrel domain-containing protein [Pedobacter sp. ok626]
MKRTFVGLLLLFLTSNLFAQLPAMPEYDFRLGLTAHPTIGWMKTEPGKSRGVSLGFSYGLLADFNFAENYAFATGLTITTINGKSTEINVPPYYDGSNTQTAYDLKYKLQYIEIPLTVKLKTGKMGDIKWYGQFGLSNDFNISAKQSAEAIGKAAIDDKNISKQINFYRAGLIVGAGGEIDVADHTSVTLGVTLNNGFTNIADDNNRKVRNHYLGLNVGVFF